MGTCEAGRLEGKDRSHEGQSPAGIRCQPLPRKGRSHALRGEEGYLKKQKNREDLREGGIVREGTEILTRSITEEMHTEGTKNTGHKGHLRVAFTLCTSVQTSVSS